MKPCAGFVLASVLFSSAVSGQTPHPSAVLSQEALHGILEKVLDSKKVPALAAAVVRGDDPIVAEAVGVRKAGSKKLATSDDCFYLGSCTKSITATLCAILVEQGKLSWDRTIVQAFPSLVETIHPDWHNVTLDQLLCHRSGLPDDRAPDPKVWPKIRALKGPLPAQRMSLMELVLPRPPATTPGTKFAYSNNGFVIAGAMCEAATGKPYEELVQSMIFEPLEMKTAGFGAPGSDGDKNQPSGHDAFGKSYSPVKPGPMSDNPAVIAPAGMARASMGDWAKYARMHLKGLDQDNCKSLLKPESFKKLHTVAPGQDYAYGWAISDEAWAGGKTLSHAGSNGRWFATITIAPAKDFAVVVASNAADAAVQEACRDTVRAVRDAVFGKK